jgi:hypothetical protein
MQHGSDVRSVLHTMHDSVALYSNHRYSSDFVTVPACARKFSITCMLSRRMPAAMFC